MIPRICNAMIGRCVFGVLTATALWLSASPAYGLSFTGSWTLTRVVNNTTATTTPIDPVLTEVLPGQGSNPAGSGGTDATINFSANTRPLRVLVYDVRRTFTADAAGDYLNVFSGYNISSPTSGGMTAKVFLTGSDGIERLVLNQIPLRATSLAQTSRNGRSPFLPSSAAAIRQQTLNNGFMRFIDSGGAGGGSGTIRVRLTVTGRWSSAVSRLVVFGSPYRYTPTP